MSQPASDPNEPRPAVPAPAPKPEVEEEFDLLVFWIQNRKLIIRLLLLALIGVGVYGAFLFKEYRRRTGSENALATAQKTEDFRKVVTEWPGTAAAGTAYFRLAEELRKENKPKEAANALKEFLDKYQVHPLRVPAAHAFAASLETAGELDAALAAYQNFSTAHSRSAFAPLGLAGQARVLAAMNRPDEARLILETVEQQFPGNPFSYDARTLLEEVRNPAGKKTGGAPRPTPVPTPAPAPEPKPVLTPDPKPAAPPKSKLLTPQAPKPATPADPQPGSPKPPAEKPIGAESPAPSPQPSPAAPQPPPAVPPPVPPLPNSPPQ